MPFCGGSLKSEAPVQAIPGSGSVMGPAHAMPRQNSEFLATILRHSKQRKCERTSSPCRGGILKSRGPDYAIMDGDSVRGPVHAMTRRRCKVIWTRSRHQGGGSVKPEVEVSSLEAEVRSQKPEARGRLLVACCSAGGWTADCSCSTVV